MTKIFVDPAAATLEGSGDRVLDSEAIRALRFLIEAGHELVLVRDGEDGVFDPLSSLAHRIVGEVPVRASEPAWYLTRDVERCVGKSARIRTVLIGSTPPSGSIHRCDTSARDVQAAVMEILAAEAMA